MASLGALAFFTASGLIRPATTLAVDLHHLVDQTRAATTTAGAPQPSRVTYQGFFASSQRAAAHALIGTSVAASDETGASTTCLVLDVEVREQPALEAGTLGVLCTVSATLQAWA